MTWTRLIGNKSPNLNLSQYTFTIKVLSLFNKNVPITLIPKNETIQLLFLVWIIVYTQKLLKSYYIMDFLILYSIFSAANILNK